MAIKIFVSSRLKLGKDRKPVREAIESMENGFKPVLFEDEPAPPDHIEIWWKKEINRDPEKCMKKIKRMIKTLNGVEG